MYLELHIILQATLGKEGDLNIGKLVILSAPANVSHFLNYALHSKTDFSLKSFCFITMVNVFKTELSKTSTRRKRGKHLHEPSQVAHLCFFL